MPELPEIETIKNDLTPHLIGKTITDVTIPSDPKKRILRRFPSQRRFIAELQGARIKKLRRRAKYLLFDLQSSRTLVMHLGMSGQLLLRSIASPKEPFIRAVFHIGKRTELRFIDPRKFGELFLQLPSVNTYPLTLDQLGPEPLTKEFSLEYLSRSLQKSKRNIKSFLMDQKVIAGLGNIYSDESLFHAKINPFRITHTLRDDEIRRLHLSIREILRKAIRNRGTTAFDKRYRDGLGRMGKFQTKLRVYQRRGKPCFVCGAIIESARIGGRTASFCPACQK